jgi:hypothetical protein
LLRKDIKTKKRIPLFFIETLSNPSLQGEIKMALFDQYTKPGVYTDVKIVNAGTPLFGTARVPVLIGEGVQSFTYSDVEIPRGSVAGGNESVVGEDISSQANGITTVFQLSYYPVVTGDGTDTVSTNPADITVSANGIQCAVAALNGALGQFTCYEIPAGSDVVVNYSFDRTDTLITNENLTNQIPTFASLTLQTLALSLSVPGATGNEVTLAFTLASSMNGVADVAAVTVNGNAVSVELRNNDIGNTIRTVGKVASLLNNVLTLSAGYILVASASTTPATAVSATPFVGGTGQSTNTTFSVSHLPITDGSNAGAATTTPSDVTVLVNGTAASVTAVNGAAGQFTLATGVTTGQTLEVSYYTNTYQRTFDVIPSPNVSSIIEVGLGPDRSDYIQGIDYVLSGNTISWGAAVTTEQGAVIGTTAPFNGLYIITTLKDDHAYLRKVTGGISNSVNLSFTLADVPVDGSGLGNPTNDPSLIKVYVGTDPIAAFTSGVVTVSSLRGDSATVVLKNPPAIGSFVYASYYRSVLNDHTLSLTATNPAASGYIITDENGIVVPTAQITTIMTGGGITPASESTTMVWPYSFSDLKAAIEGPNEVVTLTFQNDSLYQNTVPGTQAGATIQHLVLQATTIGVNVTTNVSFVAGAPVADSLAVTVTGEAISVNITTSISGVRTMGDILTIFDTYPVSTTLAGVVLATLSSTYTATPATAAGPISFSGGTATTGTNPYADRFIVTSTLSSGSAGTGYVGQTYVDARTGLKFTLVPMFPSTAALSYGYTSAPSGYIWEPADTIAITVSNATTRHASQIPTIDVPGVWTEVEQFFNVGTGNTAIITTFNGSGNGPSVGEYYYITYTVAKQASDYALKLYTSAADAYAAYGQPSAINRLSLGIYLATLNGAQTFGCIQVPQQLNSNQAADSEYIAALQTLTTTLPGSDSKVNVIVPLSTSLTVQQALSRQLITQAQIRNRGEAIGFVGFNQFTTPTLARQYARSLANSRVVAVAPFYAAVQLPTQDANGVFEVIGVTGEFIAAALAGLNLNTANDVATSLTNQNLVGFTQLLQRYDDPTKDLMAGSGITVLEENNGALYVRDYLTTDPSNPITSEPTSTTIVDYTRQQFRLGLKQFIARKFTAQLLNDITIVSNSILTSLVGNEILSAFANLSVVASPTDPTVALVTVAIKPIFALKYIQVTFSVATQL